MLPKIGETLNMRGRWTNELDLEFPTGRWIDSLRHHLVLQPPIVGKYIACEDSAWGSRFLFTTARTTLDDYRNRRSTATSSPAPPATLLFQRGVLCFCQLRTPLCATRPSLVTMLRRNVSLNLLHRVRIITWSCPAGDALFYDTHKSRYSWHASGTIGPTFDKVFRFGKALMGTDNLAYLTVHFTGRRNSRHTSNKPSHLQFSSPDLVVRLASRVGVELT
jgi:hypothetical protein